MTENLKEEKEPTPGGENDRNRLSRSRCIEAALVLLIAATATAAGAFYLTNYCGVIGPEYVVEPHWFCPSVMLAAGRGFNLVPNLSECPALAAFLAQQTLTLSPEELPENLSTIPPDPFLRSHRYLFSSVAIMWKLFGISWTSLKGFLAVAFGLTAAAAFGLFRLGMNRILSVLATIAFMFSPAVLEILPSLRDFCKAPFILGALMLLGLLIRHRAAIVSYIGLSGMLGLVLGIGLGFRQDILVCFPLSLCVVAVAMQGWAWRPFLARGTAVALFLLCFIASGWPILSVNRESQGNSAHYILQGFDMRSEKDMGIDPASYDCVYSNNDNFIHATVVSYDRRVNAGLTPGASMEGARPIDFWSPQSDDAGKQLLKQICRIFPADLIVRGYAATRSLLTHSCPCPPPRNNFSKRISAIQAPFEEHLHRFGVVYATIAFAVIAARSLPLALALFAIVLYICGYTIVQFQFRHMFHLYCLSFLVIGFLLDGILSAIISTASRLRKREDLPAVRHIPWRTRACRAAAFIVAASLLMAVPLYTARIYQRFVVERLFQRYEKATLIPVDTEQTAHARGVLFRTLEPLPGLVYPDTLPKAEVPWDYAVVEFEPSSVARIFWIQYEAENPGNDLSQQITLLPTTPEDKEPTRYFFPVYSTSAPKQNTPGVVPGSDPSQWSRCKFVGVTVPPEFAAGFKRMYHVGNTKDFPLLMGMNLPADPSARRPYQTMAETPRPGNATQGI